MLVFPISPATLADGLYIWLKGILLPAPEPEHLGKFPDWKRIIPTNNTVSIEDVRVPAIQAKEMVSIMVPGKEPPTGWQFSSDGNLPKVDVRCLPPAGLNFTLSYSKPEYPVLFEFVGHYDFVYKYVVMTVS